jgi:hypothetical protein
MIRDTEAICIITRANWELALLVRPLFFERKLKMHQQASPISLNYLNDVIIRIGFLGFVISVPVILVRLGSFIAAIIRYPEFIVRETIMSCAKCIRESAEVASLYWRLAVH